MILSHEQLNELCINLILFGAALIWSVRFNKNEMFVSENVFGVFGMYQLVLFATRLWTLIHGKI